jgi:hypothetical protein
VLGAGSTLDARGVELGSAWRWDWAAARSGARSSGRVGSRPGSATARPTRVSWHGTGGVGAGSRPFLARSAWRRAGQRGERRGDRKVAAATGRS